MGKAGARVPGKCFLPLGDLCAALLDEGDRPKEVTQMKRVTQDFNCVSSKRERTFGIIC